METADVYAHGKSATLKTANSSSSATDEEAKGFSVIREEQHTDRHCKYKRIKGQGCVIHVRICKCGSEKYPDKKHLIARQSFSEPDGVEVHFSTSCQWQRSKVSYFGKTSYMMFPYHTDWNGREV
ncbi:hypothetical protein MAR_013076 [Mya arenaria]|uniref:Uncharacterized protein n=1 Tax=Mya arenaria TaxID=6604 RepID=A0ABY7G248_MYAAR|nr:hypothetical protein MAR_013076 [Mya arenaria]